MTTAHFYLYNETKNLMLRKRRRANVRSLMYVMFVVFVVFVVLLYGWARG